MKEDQTADRTSMQPTLVNIIEGKDDRSSKAGKVNTVDKQKTGTIDAKESVKLETDKQLYYGGKGVARKLAFGSGEMVYNLPWMLVSSFLAFFMTDVALVPAAAVSVVFLISRIWDAVNDPIIGSLADRTKTKMGRYRPWMLGGSIALLPMVVLLFWAHPDWSVGARTAYSAILYMFTVVASTSWNIPFSALNGVISPYPRERASFASYRIMISALASSAAVAMFLPLVTKFSGSEGNSVRGYVLAALIVCALAIPFVFTSILGTKEAIKPPPAQKFHAKDMLNLFAKNPPLLIVSFAFLIYGFLNYGRMTVGMYYFTYVWGDPALFTFYATATGIVTAVAAFFSIYLVKLFKGKRGALLFCYLVSVIQNAVLFVLTPERTTPTVYMVILLSTAITNGAITALLYGIIGDTADYGQWKTGLRADGLCSSGTSFMLKLGGALAPTLLLSMLAARGYVANSPQQTVGALSAMNIVMNLVPAILAAIGFVLFLFYKLDEKLHGQIIADLKSRGHYDVAE